MKVDSVFETTLQSYARLCTDLDFCVTEKEGWFQSRSQREYLWLLSWAPEIKKCNMSLSLQLAVQLVLFRQLAIALQLFLYFIRLSHHFWNYLISRQLLKKP